MKKKSMMFLTGLLAGILLTGLFLLIIAPKLLFTVSESPYNFDETIAVIEESAKANSWSMPHRYDLQSTMSKHGFDVDPASVFSLCKPEIAIRILQGDVDRHLTAMMPCRIAVFEKSDGKTYIARINAKMLSRLLGSNAKSAMRDSAWESEQILAPLLY